MRSRIPFLRCLSLVLSVWSLALGAASAGVVISGGGLALVEEGGTFGSGNIATGGTAFAKDEYGLPPHSIPNVINGSYGNGQSWLGGSDNSFVGVSFGATAVAVNRIAFGRDNLGAFGDRALGVYTLQFTTVANPDASTPDSSWTTVGTIDYQSAGGDLFSSPALRHAYTFNQVTATGLRLKTVSSGAVLCIDELEIYSPATGIVLSGGGLRLVEEGGSAGTGNIAPGGTPFAQDVFSLPPHSIANINNRAYGNAESWLGATANSFVGISFGSTPVSVDRISFGRDNTGTFSDRSLGTYTVQFTTVPNPNASTPDSSWTTIGTLDYQAAGGPFFASPSLRHRFAFDPVTATGLRIRTLSAGSVLCIDELEIYSPFTGVVITGTGVSIVEEGGSFAANNLGPAGTPVALNLFPLGAHSIEGLVDREYGDEKSWLAGSPDSSFGVSFGPTPILIDRIAFSRDNTGTQKDRAIGTYTLQFTTVPYPNASTPDGSWTTIGTLDYQVAGGPYFSHPELRHLISFPQVAATGFRVKVHTDGDYIAVDEFELYGPAQGVVLNGGGLTLLQEGGTIARHNLSAGKTVFAKDDLPGGVYSGVLINNGVFGNASGWIGGTTNSFVGIVLSPTPVTVDRVAFGRDNTGVFSDHFNGIYILQYTTSVNPDSSAPDAIWTTLGKIDYLGAGGSNFSAPARRHLFGFDPVSATAFRLLTPSGAGIDELEFYSGEAELTLQQPVGTTLTDGASTNSFGSINAGSTATNTFTIRNAGTAALTLGAFTVTGPGATNFTVSAPASTSLAIGESTTFTVVFAPVHAGGSTASVHLASNDAVNASFDFTVTGAAVSSNANLAGLALSNGTLSPSFEANTTAYTASVAGSVASVTVTPLAVEPLATVTVNGTAVSNGGTSGSIALAEGANTITVRVTAPDESVTRTNTVVVTRLPGYTISGVGLTFVGEGGTKTSRNRAANGTAFAKDASAVAPHAIAKLNDGIYGDASSWISGTADSFAGVSFGTTAQAFDQVAFGRDQTGTKTDLALGTYTLQFTTVANPDASTSDENWTTLGTVNFVSTGGGAFASPAARHVFAFPKVMATGFRVKTLAADTALAIDELELSLEHDTTAPVISLHGNVAVETASVTGTAVSYAAASATDDSGFAPVLGYSKASGSVFPVGVTTVTITARDEVGNTSTSTFQVTVNFQFPAPVLVEQGGTLLRTNLAETGTAFAKDVYPAPPHSIANLKDGKYRNEFSWLAGSTNSFVGINLGATPVRIQRVAFGRDNSGGFPDRTLGLYTFQVTTVPNPGASTPDSAWLTLGTADYRTLSDPILFSQPHLRHSFTFTPVEVTGFRMLVQSTGELLAVDELELYGYDPLPELSVEQPAGTPLSSGISTLTFAAQEVQSASAPRTVTLKNIGNRILNVESVTLLGANAAEFSLDTTGLNSPVPIRGGSTSVQLEFRPTTLGVRTATLRIRTDDPNTPVFDLLVSGTGQDTTSPVITSHPDVTVATTNVAGMNVTFDAATASDNSGMTPVIGYTPLNGSLFPLGTNSVTITATDANGNVSTSNFRVIVRFIYPAPVLVEQGGRISATNLALTGTAFAKNVYPSPPHSIPHANDGIFGNSFSWLAGSPDSFVGINLGATPLPIRRVAFGRDNTGLSLDRSTAQYTFQFTTVPNPNESTPDEDWTTIGPVDYRTLVDETLFTSAQLRHLFSIFPVEATGFRLLIHSEELEIAIDELELYGYEPVSALAVESPAGTPLSSGTSTISFAAQELKVDSALRTITLTNSGTRTLAIQSVALSGANAGDFAIDTTAMAAVVPFGDGSTSFQLWFRPTAAGVREASLRIRTDDPKAPQFDLLLSGVGVDTTKPVIEPHPDVRVVTTNRAGVNVNFDAAVVADNAAAAPVVAYNPTSGSLFPLGTNVVTITATDAEGNAGTSTFQIIVALAPFLVEEDGFFAANNLARTGTAFAKDVYPAPPHSIPNLNDGNYGNDFSWLSESTDTFAGINLGAAPVLIKRVAFGRDNQRALRERDFGTCTFEFTQVPNPDGSTPDSSWITLGTVDFRTLVDAELFTAPHTRHVFSISPVEATGFRLRIQTDGLPPAIDELELYGYDPVAELAVEAPVGTVIHSGTTTFTYAEREVQSESASQVLTVKNSGTKALKIRSISFLGAGAGSYFLDTTSLNTNVAFSGGSTQVGVVFRPAATGIQAATLRLLTDDPVTPTFDVALTGTGKDTMPPVIQVHPDVMVGTADPTGSQVTFAAADVTDNSGNAPTVEYSPANGSHFPLGTTLVTITATDATGNVATSTFKVTVNTVYPAPVLVEQGGGINATNLALTGTAFAKNVYPSPPHSIAHANDGNFGNSFSWLANSVDSFVGINLGATPVRIRRVAFGRDNLGFSPDRSIASYTFQFTSVPNPDETTAASDWVTLGTVDYSTLRDAVWFSAPSLRHVFTFTPVEATGFRLLIERPDQEVAIDELELYNYEQSAQLAVEQPAGTPLTAGAAFPAFDAQELQTDSALRTFSLTNSGTKSMAVRSVALVGPMVGDFVLNISSMSSVVPATNGVTSFSVLFHPRKSGDRSATLRIATDDPTTPVFDVPLQGSGVDTIPPVIASHPNVVVATTNATGINVSYEPAVVTDNSGNAVTLAYSIESGAFFALGTTTVTITAKDEDNNESTSTFTVTVTPPPVLELEQPAGTVLAGTPPTVGFGSASIGSAPVVKSFVVKNTGGGTLHFSSVSTTGGNAAEFEVNTKGLLLTVPPGSSTALSVAFRPRGTGARSTELQLVSDDPYQPTYSVTLTGTGVDVTAPVIVQHLDRTVVTSDPTGVVVNFNPVLVSDDSGEVPTVTYSPESGSRFPVGTNTVNITARDAADNASTSSFTIVVRRPVQLGVEQPAGTALAGTVLLRAWGSLGTTSEEELPTDLNGVVSVVSGPQQSLALKRDGSVVGWGVDTEGMVSGAASITDAVSIAAGSAFAVALKSDGTVVQWGGSGSFPYSPPSGLLGVTAISAAGTHALALKDDGTVVAWGANGVGELDVPNGLTGVVAVSAGRFHSLALKSDGTVVAWGQDLDGALNVPSGLTQVVAISAGELTSTAVKRDGGVVQWGRGCAGVLASAPTPRSLRAVASGQCFVLGLLDDGTLRGSGDNDAGGQLTFARGLSNVLNVSAALDRITARVVTPPSVAFGSHAIHSTGTRTFTLRNSGLGALRIASLELVGGNASEFSLRTNSTLTTIPAGESTTMEVVFAPVTFGRQTTRLRIRSEDPEFPDFFVALSGTGSDTTPPTLTPPANLVVSAAEPAGIAVFYPAAQAVDDFDSTPTVTYSHPAGTVFPRGVTTVTVTATDASSNSSTATFTVTVQTTANPPVVRSGDAVPPNLANAGTPFAQDVIGSFPHSIANINNRAYGNSESWIAGASASFLGINLGATPVYIDRVAFGRDNRGVFGDRTDGSYTLQFTTVANPDETTPDASWQTIGTINYPGSGATAVSQPALRHLYAFKTVAATGFRINVNSGGGGPEICIDELELYGPPIRIVLEQPAGTEIDPTAGPVLFGSQNENTSGTPKTFTIRRVGQGRLNFDYIGMSEVGGDDFLVDTTGTRLALETDADTTTFTMTFHPTGLGVRQSKLFFIRNGVTVLQLPVSGIGVDHTPPVIASHVNVAAIQTSSGGAVVHYAPASATDNSGEAPILSYSKASGTLFPVGDTVVTITATDGAGNFSTRTFTVTVGLPPRLLVEFPSGTPFLADTHSTPGVTNWPGIAFGTNAAGTRVTNTVTLRNTGAIPLTLTVDLADASAEDPGFVLDTGATVGFVPVGGSTTLEAVFVPRADTNYAAHLRIASMDPDFPEFLIRLTGTGTDTHAPVIGTLSEITALASADSGVRVIFPDPPGTDDSGEVPVWSYSHPSGTLFPLGVTTVTATASDRTGNTATTNFTVAVFASRKLFDVPVGGDVPEKYTLGGSPFAKDEISSGGYPANNVVDLRTGESGSWIAGSTNSFVGVQVASFPQPINRVAFGRDNTGTLTADRWQGTYTLQYTTANTVNASTPDSEWKTIGTVTYPGTGVAAITDGSVRHLFSFQDIRATGFRILTQASGLPIAIDELELYPPESRVVLQQPVGVARSDGTDPVVFGDLRVGSAPVTRTFTVVNVGIDPLIIRGVRLNGDHPEDYAIDTTAMKQRVLPSSDFTTFTVTFTPKALGARDAIVEIDSNSEHTRGAAALISGKGIPNQSPVAADDTLTRIEGKTVKFHVSKLTANDTDPEGDSLSLVSQTTTSANGVTVVAADGWISYRANGSTANTTDTFTYTIDDGFGGTSTGTVTLNVVAAPTETPTFNLVNAVTAGPGNRNVTVQFQGAPNRQYLVYAQSALGTPWTLLNSGRPVTSQSNGRLSVNDPNIFNSATRFYRTEIVP